MTKPADLPGPQLDGCTMLACPECGSLDLSTVEDITATGHTFGIGRAPDGSVRIAWEGTVEQHTQTTVGVQCGCGFFYRGTFWYERLVRTDERPPQEY